MLDLSKHLIRESQTLSEALEMLNKLGDDLTIFVVNADNQLLGTVTDGDIRRGLMNNLDKTTCIREFMKEDFTFIYDSDFSVSNIIKAKSRLLDILPVLDDQKRILKLINFSTYISYLPVDAFIVAGGDGMRLRPLTESVPKPLLKIGGKPILEHGIDWISRFGIENIQISINYLGSLIREYFGNGTEKGVVISYVEESSKLGTIGAISLANTFKYDNVLLMNSDLLTNIDLEDFFKTFEMNDADMSVASIPYNISVPYAVLDTFDGQIVGLKEKPSMTYQSNAGIYLIKKKHLERVPKGEYYNATDLIEELINSGYKVTYYPILDYWLDIGKLDDFKKAEIDIKHIKFER